MLPSRLGRYGVGEFGLGALQLGGDGVVWLIDERSEIGAPPQVWRQPRIERGKFLAELLAARWGHHSTPADLRAVV
jgi:hypothetical protein